ncbi:diguanylate cyclase (GGDEF)-like protein/PAS domain S-box-containing protein [Massilia sp. UYP11]|uniref:EAL domain-containing protein n=1 Tax=Massilia sp. UYP11 TaxID=1756385 RepID=UPI003D200E4C
MALRGAGSPGAAESCRPDVDFLRKDGDLVTVSVVPIPGRRRAAVRRLRHCLMLAVLLLAGAAGAAPAPLRVVMDNNYPPYLFVDGDGQPEGYLVDLWRLWEEKTGVPVVLQPMQWSAAQQTMREGRADVIDMLFRTAPRAALYDFSRPYATLDASIYVDAAIPGIHDVHALRGVAVGVQRGDPCVDRLMELGVASLHAYPNYTALLAAADAGEIGVFCMDDMPANYFLYLYRGQQRFAKAFTLYSGQFHWAVRKGDAATLARVEQGMNRITPDERAALRRKWFGQPVQFRSYLRLLAIAVACVLAATAAALLWIRALRRAVRAATADVMHKHAQLEQTARDLVADQARLRSVLEGSPDAMALKDAGLVYVHCNRAFEELVGLGRDRILGRRDESLFDDREFVALLARGDAQVLRSGRTFRSDDVIQVRHGEKRCLELIKVPIRDPAGRVAGVLAVSRDVTARRQTERELSIAAVAFESQDGMLITDADAVIERVNAAFTRITGFAAREAVGSSPRILRSGLHESACYDEMRSALTLTGYWHGELVNRHRDGNLYTVRMSISAVADAQGKPMHYVVNFQDISAEKQAHALATRLRQFDALTDLPNRAMLSDRIARAVVDRVGTAEYGAVMMMGLDHFRKINDSLGHAAGDRLLVEVARRFLAAKRDCDVLARFSGDSFVLLCESLGSDRHVAMTRALAIAEAARHAMANQVVLDGHRFACTGSVGVTLFQDGATAGDALLRQAELAMYKSKKGGRDRVSFFEDAMQSEIDERNWMEDALREAIAKDQLVLFYQVQVDLDGRAIGAEALLRWNHPERGTISPAVFIPLAEETGLILPVGRWALATACRQLARWADDPLLRTLTLAVNISPLQFKSDGFVDDVLAEVAHSGAPVGRLKFEVTESLAIDDFTSSISRLNALKSHGFLISLDDFGTGNSSLNYLTKLPLTQLKIDKSFVDELPGSERDAMVAQTIIAMGKGLELEVIAEGVETSEQRAFLAAHGCHAFQGYLFGKPMPLEEFEAMVRAGRWAGTTTVHGPVDVVSRAG